MASEPLDPYAPYADSGPADAGDAAGSAVDQSGDDESVPLPPGDIEDDRSRGRRIALLHGGLVGFTTGLALAGPSDELGDLRGSAVLLGMVGGGAGLLGAHFLARKYAVSEGQAAAVSSFGLWGATGLGYLADLATGVGDTTGNQIVGGVTLGALAGTAAGMLYARKHDPAVGDVSVVNSFGLYGMTSGLLLAVAIDPLESEGYSINGLLGSAIGLGAGMYAAGRIDTSRRRMFYVDLGAAAGALVPWLILYPAVSDNDHGVQATGLISMLGLMVGGYATWRITARMDRTETIGRKRMARSSVPPVPGLLQRDRHGRWGVGMLSVRPMSSHPALAPGMSLSAGLGVDLLGGQF